VIEPSQRRIRRAMLGISAVFIVGIAVGVTLGIAYEPHATPSALVLHIAIACVGIGLICMIVGLLIVAVFGGRGQRGRRRE
jgi:hypothetical protein